MKSILLVKKRLGLVEMTSGLVNASFSLPKWLAVKMIFLAHCCSYIVILLETPNNGRNSILLTETIS